ncbi:hypothetical protein [Roseivivax marinus]|uniref:hypothetical protein n=1 Tax=Roseivivax marinus TaxID=1379903 RepID=UPI00273E8AC0|nr:hypothetical protein [Roseivivax marinus]
MGSGDNRLDLLKPGPRALYVELKRRFNGGNNGRILMSQREAAQLLNVHRNTVGGFFDELEERGLIRETKRGHLGADGHGIASTWALCELPTSDGKPPDTGFRTWQPKQKPVTKSVQPCHKNCASPADLPRNGAGPAQ